MRTSETQGSLTCRDAAEWMESYLRDELEGPRLTAMIEHLGRCGPCRARAAEADPLRGFTLLARPLPADPRVWEGFWEGIAARLDEPSRPRSRAWFEPARWPAAALAAAAALALGLLLIEQFEKAGGRPAGETAALSGAAETSAADAGEPAGAAASLAEESGAADDYLENLYADQIAEALPSEVIVRTGEVRDLRLLSVEERGEEEVSSYRLVGGAAALPVTDLQRSEEMERIMVYRLTLGGGPAPAEEIDVVSFESERFPF